MINGKFNSNHAQFKETEFFNESSVDICQRIHIDVKNLDNENKFSFENLRNQIEGRGRRTIISNLNEHLRNDDSGLKRSECFVLFSSLGSSLFDVVIDLATPESCSDSGNANILSCVKDLVISKRLFNITPLILISSKTDWGSDPLKTALELSSTVGSPIFVLHNEEKSDVYGIDSSVTLNLPLISLTAKNESSFLANLQEYLDISVHRQWEKGRRSIAVCVLGGDEVVRNLVGKGIESSLGKAVAY